MIILHTSDWHIGQYFFGYDRRDEHLYFFDWLKKTISEQQADALLVAGDVFDSPNPSAESQRIFYRILREFTTENPKLQIVVTAGNHDSAARLEAPNPLLEGMNVFIKGIVRKHPDGTINYRDLLVPLVCNGKTECWCMAVPYLRQGDYPQAETYNKGIREMYDSLYKELQDMKESKEPIIAMGHLQATGSEVSENDRSERTVIGGIECVSPDIFDRENIIYTALGHLHKPQRVSRHEHIRYCGSPLPMSFSEKNYKQGVNLIETEKGKLKRIDRIGFEPPVKLISIPPQPRPLHEVLEEIACLPDGEITFESPYLELKVLITEPEPSMRHQIETALKNKSVRLTSAVPFRTKHEKQSRSITYEELKTISPVQMAEDIFTNRYGNEMPDKIKSLLLSVIQEVGK